MQTTNYKNLIENHFGLKVSELKMTKGSLKGFIRFRPIQPTFDFAKLDKLKLEITAQEVIYTTDCILIKKEH